MGNIKKFKEMGEKFVITDEFLVYAEEAFRDLIDQEMELNNRTPINSAGDWKKFEIFITMNNLRKNRNRYDVSSMIKEYERETDTLRDIEITLKRIYDNYGVYPAYYENTNMSGETWVINLVYDHRINNNQFNRSMYANLK